MIETMPKDNTVTQIIMVDGRECVTFMFAKPPPQSIKGIIPAYVHTPCNCECIRINDKGHGTMALCKEHLEICANAKYGDVFIPRLQIDFNDNPFEIVKSVVKAK